MTHHIRAVLAIPVFASMIVFISANVFAQTQAEARKHISEPSTTSQPGVDGKYYQCTRDITIQVLGASKEVNPCNVAFATFGSASMPLYEVSNKARMGEVTEDDVVKVLREKGGLSEGNAKASAKPIYKGLRSGEFKALTGVTAVGDAVFVLWESYSLKDSDKNAPK